MVTDPIADLITRLKNGSDVNKDTVVVASSKFVENVAHALKKAGYITTVTKKGTKFNKDLHLGLSYTEGSPRIHGCEKISRSSRRIYEKSLDIRSYRNGFGNTFYSTPKGILTDIEAKKLKVGGEVLFRIW